MTRIALLCPGQGSQRVGMGRHLCEAYPAIRRQYFDRADEILGFSLSHLLFEGPEEELVKTENQQPAIFLVSVAIAAVLAEAGIEPAAAAGHSLGEYSALAAAGALDFEPALRLVRRRGELMAGVAARTGGIMAAVLGLPAGEVEAACREAAHLGVVEVANYNSPVQTVISGEEPAVRAAMVGAKDRGAQRVIQLAVSAPFHCRLMAPLAEEFRPALDAVEVRAPRIPVIANVDAEEERDKQTIRRNLVAQLAAPVRWTDSMRRLAADGIDTVIEAGPGKVLTGLMRAIDPKVQALPTNDPAGIERAMTAVMS